MIRCACPSCQAVLNCSPSTAGAVVHCPRCGNGVQVPTAGAKKTKGTFKNRTEVATGAAGSRRHSPAPPAPAPWSPFDDLLRRMSSLSEQFRELQEGVQKAIRIASEDPEMALTRARKVLEYVIRDVYERRCKEPPGTRPLENLLQRLVKDGHLPDRLDAYATGIRKLGNVGTHTFGERITASDVYQSLGQLIPILEWYFEVERPDALAAAAPQPQPQPAAPPLAPTAARPGAPAVSPALQQLVPAPAPGSPVPAQRAPGAKPPAPLERQVLVWPAALAAALLLLGGAGGILWYVAHPRPQDTAQVVAVVPQGGTSPAHPPADHTTDKVTSPQGSGPSAGKPPPAPDRGDKPVPPQPSPAPTPAPMPVAPPEPPPPAPMCDNLTGKWHGTHQAGVHKIESNLTLNADHTYRMLIYEGPDSLPENVGTYITRGQTIVFTTNTGKQQVCEYQYSPKDHLLIIIEHPDKSPVRWEFYPAG